MRNVMKIETINIEKLIPYARNPRNNDNAVDEVASSIKEFGFRQPIVVDTDMVIVAGHTRYLACKKLDIKTVPIHIADSLSPNQIKAFRIADNRVNQNSTWDYDLLKLEFDDLPDVDKLLTGFSQEEMNSILNGWESDIDLPSVDGDVMEGINQTIKIEVEGDYKEDAIDLIKKALDETSIQYDIK